MDFLEKRINNIVSKQVQTSNRDNSILQWLWTENGLVITDLLRRNIITEKVKLLLTLYRPLPPPSFLLSKSKHLAHPSKSQTSLDFNYVKPCLDLVQL